MSMGEQRRWWGLATLVLPVLLISVDGTALSFAVPKLSESLQPTSAQLLWIIDIYSFVLAGLLVTMGTVGDRIGRRRLLMIGAVCFSAASLIAAFATSAAMLIAARALLGVAGSTLMPSSLSLIRNLFINDRERQTAISLWASSFAVGTTIGPIVGGFLLEHFWWGSIFVVNVPVTLAFVLLAPRLIDESRDPNPGRFDLVSSGLSMATMLPAVYAVKTFAEGQRTVWMVVALATGIVSGVAFVKRQGRSSHPMIDTSLFRLSDFRIAVTANVLSCFGFAASMFVITQYLQLVLGFSALAAGAALIPNAGFTAAAMMAAPAVARRFGALRVVTVGFAIGAIGFGLMSLLTVDGSALVAIGAICLGNFGLAATMTVAIDAIVAAVPPEKAGSGAAISETSNELGIALGTAIVGSVLTAIYRPRIDLIPVPGPQRDLARETLGSAIVAARQLPAQAAETLITGAQRAFVDGAQVACLMTAVVLVAATMMTARSSRGQRNRAKPTNP